MSAKNIKNPAAVALGRLGGAARVAKGLSMADAERRTELSQIAIKKRWTRYHVAKRAMDPKHGIPERYAEAAAKMSPAEVAEIIKTAKARLKTK